MTSGVMLIGYLYIFFGEFLFIYSYWIILLSCNFSYILNIALYGIYDLQIFSPILRTFLTVSFEAQKLLTLMINLSTFFCLACAIGVLFNPKSHLFTPVFSSEGFVVLAHI
jgi:hypothetical protein